MKTPRSGAPRHRGTPTLVTVYREWVEADRHRAFSAAGLVVAWKHAGRHVSTRCPDGDALIADAERIRSEVAR